jgi:serine/threonine protein kinase
VQFFLYQLLRGLKYIHSANVIHRDLVRSQCPAAAREPAGPADTDPAWHACTRNRAICS